MSERRDVEALFSRWVEHHVVHGEQLAPEMLCADRPELVAPLRSWIRRYLELDRTLDDPADRLPSTGERGPLPSFAGFRTIERLGGGGAGDVYKLEDEQLGRTVAAKILRRDNRLATTLEDFLREARALALFEDPRIVRIHELRASDDPPFLLMEYVDGFQLGQVGPSLEFPRRARLIAEVAEAIQHAHSLGLQHRDLKPENILVDARLEPKILDFGLSHGAPDRGHGKGTPAYMAPEQLDPSRPIDERTDVYALGVILYELLTGVPPYHGSTASELLESIRRGQPRLPAEVTPDVPEPLQAIALKAMEREPERRYASAREMALDLRRYLEGQPVLARPSHYRSTLEQRTGPHLEEIREWERLRLIHPHEAERLEDAYAGLTARDDDWIVDSRLLSPSQITLYLGALLLVAGGIFYFGAYALEAFGGVLGPLLVLGLPFAGLNVAARRLEQRGQRAVAVAYYLGAVVLLPLLLLIIFNEVGLWPPDSNDEHELFDEGLSNRRLQLAALAASGWALWLSVRTRSVGLGSCFTFLAVVFYLTVLTDRGLGTWLFDDDWAALALHLAPLLVAVTLAANWNERFERGWLARPLYFAAAGLLVIVLELLALDGRGLEYLGVSLGALQPPDVTDPRLLDTLAAMAANGVLIYLAGWLADRRGTPLMRVPGRLLIAISPFAMLQPLSWLSRSGEYSLRFDWLYLLLALTITVLSHYRQRKSFYFAGLLNTAGALWFITSHHEWWDRPAWGGVVIGIGLAVLALGLALDKRERSQPGGVQT